MYEEEPLQKPPIYPTFVWWRRPIPKSTDTTSRCKLKTTESCAGLTPATTTTYKSKHTCDSRNPRVSHEVLERNSKLEKIFPQLRGLFSVGKGHKFPTLSFPFPTDSIVHRWIPTHTLRIPRFEKGRTRTRAWTRGCAAVLHSPHQAHAHTYTHTNMKHKKHAPWCRCS